MSLFDQHVSVKKVRVLTRKNPWFNAAIHHAMIDRDLLYNDWKINRFNESWQRFDGLSLKLLRLIVHLVLPYVTYIFNSILAKSDFLKV